MYRQPETPVHATTTRTRPSAVQRAVIAITDAGKEVESSDATTGIVMSKWFSPDGFGGDDNRFRIRVVFDESNGYEIEALCQLKDSMSKTWGEDGCDAKLRPQFVLDLVARIDRELR